MPSHYVALDDIDHLLTDTDAMLTIDTGHARIAGYEAADLAEFLAVHGDRVSHFHLNDTTGPSDDHLSFGAGTIDFETIFEPLHRADWSGTLSVESKSCQPAYLDLSLQQLDAVLDAGR
jgi:sugar phosphate isomerase/epimerase